MPPSARKGSARRRTHFSAPNLHFGSPHHKTPPSLSAFESVTLTVPGKPSEKHTNEYMFCGLGDVQSSCFATADQKNVAIVSKISSQAARAQPRANGGVPQIRGGSRVSEGGRGTRDRLGQFERERHTCNDDDTGPLTIFDDGRNATGRDCDESEGGQMARFCGEKETDRKYTNFECYALLSRAYYAKKVATGRCTFPSTERARASSTGGGSADNKRNGPPPGVEVAVHVGEAEKPEKTSDFSVVLSSLSVSLNGPSNGCVSRAWGKGGRETRERELARPRAPLVQHLIAVYSRSPRYNSPASIKTTDNIKKKKNQNVRENGGGRGHEKTIWGDGCARMFGKWSGAWEQERV
ncbi:hypothetical protein EDB87DRAFT_1577809 [Lactarius vividus]|nr:hypothetical protein EDB87DRAFT_1577809 [Lactarius vividus]